MPSIQRPLAAEAMLMDLRDESSGTPSPGPGRNARTLVKDGSLRVTLVGVGPGGSIAEHQAPGPITIQALRGHISVAAAGVVHEFGPGQLLSLKSGVRHAITSTDGAEFLLTLSHAPQLD